MSYTNSQRKALCSDWLCLIMCVFALCMACHTMTVTSENEMQYQALNEDSPVSADILMAPFLAADGPAVIQTQGYVSVTGDAAYGKGE